MPIKPPPTPSDTSAANVITTDSEGNTYLASPARELVNSYLRQRMDDVFRNDIEKWIDARWDKKRDWLKTWLGWGSLAALITACVTGCGMIWSAVRAEVNSQVKPAVDSELKKVVEPKEEEFNRLQNALREAAEKANNARLAADTATTRATDEANKISVLSKRAYDDATTERQQMDRLDANTQEAIKQQDSFKSLMENVLYRESARVHAVTEGLKDLFDKYPRETSSLKERFELPLGTIVLVQPSEVSNFLNGHMEWLEASDTKTFDAADAKWTLADQRPVPNSAYAKDLGYARVPDGSQLASAFPVAGLTMLNAPQAPNTGAKVVPFVLIKINY